MWLLTNLIWAPSIRVGKYAIQRYHASQKTINLEGQIPPSFEKLFQYICILFHKISYHNYSRIYECATFPFKISGSTPHRLTSGCCIEPRSIRVTSFTDLNSNDILRNSMFFYMYVCMYVFKLPFNCHVMHHIQRKKVSQKFISEPINTDVQ